MVCLRRLILTAGNCTSEQGLRRWGVAEPMSDKRKGNCTPDWTLVAVAFMILQERQRTAIVIPHNTTRTVKRVKFSTIWSDIYHRVSANSHTEDVLIVLLESAALFHTFTYVTLRSLANMKGSKGRKGDKKGKGKNCNYLQVHSYVIHRQLDNSAQSKFFEL